tara:strand:+ start:4403 stop:4855 length:453 start_codon:yes stop_codon:yes gene_type:complete
LSGPAIDFLGKRPLNAQQKAALRAVLIRLLEDHEVSLGVNVCFVDDSEIRQLNRDYLSHDYATDVVTFPMRTEGKPVEGDPLDGDLLGEVVVSVDTARTSAHSRGVDYPVELALYAIHGALHLLGYDDKDAAGRRKMRRAERIYLDSFLP